MALTLGSRGADVRKLQQMLNIERAKAKLPAIAVDGVYGGETAAAVKAFQAQHANELPRFGADAKVADETMPVLAGASGTMAAPVGKVEAYDLPPPQGMEDTLARSLAGAEPSDPEGYGMATPMMEGMAPPSPSYAGMTTDEMPMEPDPEGYGMASSATAGGMQSPAANYAGQTSDAMTADESQRDAMTEALNRMAEAKVREMQSGNSPLAGAEEYIPEEEPAASPDRQMFSTGFAPQMGGMEATEQGMDRKAAALGNLPLGMERRGDDKALARALVERALAAQRERDAPKMPENMDGPLNWLRAAQYALGTKQF